MIFRKTIFIFALLCMGMTALAQKQAAASVFNLVTYGDSGRVIGKTHGFFFGAKGEALAPWTPFVGARRAVVVDAKGRETEVDALLGASEIYNVCKFRVKGGNVPSPLMAAAPQQEGADAWIVANAAGKEKTVVTKIKRTEPFAENYTYYILETADSTLCGCPLVNKAGQVLGVYGIASTPNATDARFTNDFKLNGLSINDRLLGSSGIRVAMPTDADDALLMLTLSAGRGDSLQHDSYVDDYLRMFPEKTEGYTEKAMELVGAHRFASADSIMRRCIEKADNKADAHFNFSRVIYQKEIYIPNPPYAKWGLDAALAEAKEAYSINPLPLYRHQQAQVIYAQGQYQQAYDIFMDLSKDLKFRSGEIFFEAASCKRQLQAAPEEILVLMDSAVECDKLNASTAVYLLSRAQLYEQLGNYRKALQDYNRYDTLQLGRAGDGFYYTRYACELELHMYQQALNDIAHAIVLNRNVPAYYAEMAQLQLTVRLYDDAEKTADMGIAAFPDYADNYLVKGLALILGGKKADGLAVLATAKEKGAEKADELMEKYK